MTEDEKNFFYFKLHDSDNNDVLDGLELLQAATHHSVHVGHEEEGESEKSDEDKGFEHIIGTLMTSVTSIREFSCSEPTLVFRFLPEIIDDFIQFADFNNDGYLNYAEYMQAIKQDIDIPINNRIDNVNTKEFK